MARTLSLPAAGTKLRGGKECGCRSLTGRLPQSASGWTSREITLKTGAAKAYLLTDRPLHPDWPEYRHRHRAPDVIADQCGRRRCSAVDDLLTGPHRVLSPGRCSKSRIPGRDRIVAVAAMGRNNLPIRDRQAPARPM